jgi:hypothetical protein
MVCQQNNKILSGDGQNKFVACARGDFSSFQFFRIPALAVDLFRSAANLSNKFHLFISSKLAL